MLESWVPPPGSHHPAPVQLALLLVALLRLLLAAPLWLLLVGFLGTLALRHLTAALPLGVMWE